MTRVKVCGLTREGDVRLAVSLGVWACGFVLSESPRRVSLERARRLAAAAAGALTVGVVTTEPADWVAAALALAGFGAVQLSAGVDGPSVAAVRAAAASLGLRPLLIAAADTPDAEAAELVLLDARSPGRYGGTGRTLDWAALANARKAGRDDAAARASSTTSSTVAAAAALDPRRLVLAGGLTAGNVAEAVVALGPLAVDVASGVERAPGRKDEGLMDQFFAAVTAADALRRAEVAQNPSPEVAP